MPSKSESGPVGRGVVDKLLGAIDKYRASHGLLVSWGVFKSSVQKEMASSFFKLRLWSRKEFLEKPSASYDRLDEDINADLPLKRVWVVTLEED